MALSRKKWNNILIIACVFMVAVLTFIDSKTNKMPNDAHALFDESNQLTQLQFNGIWLNKSASQWRCDDSVLNCQPLATAWSKLMVSAVQMPANEIQLLTAPVTLTISINHQQQAQHWQYYPAEGLLQSASSNWYQIPPSLRSELAPIISTQ
ncbi:hypothetical protein J8L86_10875 [Shewanella sp. MMG014]|uniref:hypothetical protein n=1 Tax=Shewanella sp. MMG014 TaxID=2822691 RepID=UPI001B35D056|nr:hypothetical protein [Shewanella sp. MMG014]MBQ4890349.1 hypothetical protein [Shewanella sp. MMG014]